jgi:hypothetical protein
LLGSLRVLVGLILIGRGRRGGLLGRILRRRIGLLGRILLVTLLGLGLIANSKYCSLSCGGSGRQRLFVGDWRQIGFCGIRA